MARRVFLLVAVLLVAGCGSSAGGGLIPGGQTTFFLGLQPGVVENADDVKLFDLGFGNSQLPVSASWSHTMPPVGDQGSQGSCVGWSVGYYVKTSWEQREEGWSTTAANHQFSPAWVYNLINNGVDQGADPEDALDLLVNEGCATLATMPYDDANHTAQPSAAANAEADDYENQDKRLFGTYDERDFKEYLAHTGPFIFGIKVYENFFQTGPIYSSTDGSYQGAHTIACVGYDDTVSGGAFRLVNSWGQNWGDGGYVWVTYGILEQLFLGAWGMVDGPNTGGPPPASLPAPSGFQASDREADYYVALSWNMVSGAAGYTLQRQSPNGAFQTIASPPADTTYHYDFNVQPGTTYTYRLAAVDAFDEEGTWTGTVTGRTSTGGGGGGLTLTASHPNTGVSYPDRIELNWTQLSGSHYYVIVRADSSEGLRNDQFFILDILKDEGRLDDYVSPGSAFAYKVFAVDASSFDLSGESDIVVGSTSGLPTGQDLGILDAYGPLSVAPDEKINASDQVCSVDYFNYASASSPSQRVFVGIEYYFSSGDWGILEYWDSAWTQRILDVPTGSSLPSFDWTGYWLGPHVPEYLYSSGTGVGHWWYFEVWPLDASDQELEDTDPWDNEYWTWDEITVQ